MAPGPHRGTSGQYARPRLPDLKSLFPHRPFVWRLPESGLVRGVENKSLDAASRAVIGCGPAAKGELWTKSTRQHKAPAERGLRARWRIAGRDWGKRG